VGPRDRIAGNLRDPGDDMVALTRVQMSPDLAEWVREADYVVEAVREDRGVKRKLFAVIRRDRACRPPRRHTCHSR